MSIWFDKVVHAAAEPSDQQVIRSQSEKVLQQVVGQLCQIVAEVCVDGRQPLVSFAARAKREAHGVRKLLLPIMGQPVFAALGHENEMLSGGQLGRFGLEGFWQRS